MELALLLAALAGGTSLTFLAPLPLSSWARVAAGFCGGTALLGLAALVLGSLFGLGPGTVTASALIALAPVLVLAWPPARRRAAAAWGDARAGIAGMRGQPLASVLIAALAIGGGLVLWRVFDRSCFVDAEGIQTADSHNFGDLPFHLAVIQGFVRGDNMPPEHPELAGARLTYPFLVDLVTALMVKAGASPVRAIVVHDWALGMALAVLLYHMARRWTGDRVAAVMTPLLVLLSGGLGFLLLARDAAATGVGWWDLLARPPDDYTMRDAAGLRWGNALTTLLVTQRSFLMGLPLFALAATLWWEAVSGDARDDPRTTRVLLGAAGVVVGALPLVHGHSFAAAMAIAAALAVLFPRRGWTRFFAAALVLAAPQILWLSSGSAMEAERFLALHVGWDRGARNPIAFWLWNTGVFIPLLAAAFVWRNPRRPLPARLARFYLPFAACFVVPNVLRLSPWIWDNIKFLFLWWAASAPFVALVLARLFRASPWARAAGAALLAAATLAGALDVWRVARPVRTYVVFPAAAITAADAIAAATPPRALILHAPAHDSPVLLTGRRSLLGYEGHIWSQGLDKGERPGLIARIYRGGAGAEAAIAEAGADYVLLGPQERQEYRVDEARWSHLPLVVESGEYLLYRAR